MGIYAGEAPRRRPDAGRRAGITQERRRHDAAAVPGRYVCFYQEGIIFR